MRLDTIKFLLLAVISFFLAFASTQSLAKKNVEDNYSSKVNSVKPNLKSVGSIDEPTVEDLMASGQLGGILHPTVDTENSSSNLDSKRVMLESSLSEHDILEQNSAFAKAMDEWNQHKYKRASGMMEDYLAQYPDGLWAGEADLHLGCEARFTGRYREANKRFNRIIKKYEKSNFKGAQIVAEKAKVRLAVLKVLENNFSEATRLFTEIHASSDDWRQRTYASHWIQRISRLKRQGKKLADCGTQALSHVLAQQGLEKEAQEVRQLEPDTNQGFNIKSLQSISEKYEQSLTAIKVTSEELKHIPLPAIAHVDRSDTGGLGHYWIVEAVVDDVVTVFDKQNKRRFEQSLSEFNKEWSGNLLVFGKQASLPGEKLTDVEASKAYGGCCGVQQPIDELGNKCKSTAQGCPRWQINPINLNLYVHDTPLWYQTPYGPNVELTLSYNSQSSIVQYETVGNKWILNYSSYVVEDPGNAATVFMPDGENKIFLKEANSSDYEAAYGDFEVLKKISAHHYQLVFQDGTVYDYAIPEGTYSQQPLLVSITDAHGQSLTMNYSQDVQLTSVTDAQGRDTTFEYDEQGRMIKATDPFGRFASFEYAFNGNLLSITDMGGYKSSFEYDSNKYIKAIDYPDFGKWRFKHEIPDGIQIPGPDGTLYPAPNAPMWENHRITVTAPNGDRSEYFYFGDGGEGYWIIAPDQYVEYQDENTNNHRNAIKTELTVDRLSNGSTNITGVALVPDSNSGTGIYRNRMYNDKGKVWIAHEGTWNKRGPEYEYNEYNQLTKIKHGSFAGTLSLEYLSPEISFPTKITYPENDDGYVLTTEHQYDALNYLESTTETSTLLDEVENRTTSVIRNSHGQVIELDGPIDGSADTIFLDYYDCSSGVSFCGALMSVTNPYGQQVQFLDYSQDGRATHVLMPNGMNVFYEYDDLGRLKTERKVASNGIEVTMNVEFRGVNKVSKVSYSNGTFVAFEYDDSGILKATSNHLGHRAEFDYDKNGNLTQADIYNDLMSLTATSKFIYDEANTITAIQDAYDNYTNLNYNEFNDLVGIRDHADDESNLELDGFGRVTGVRFNDEESHQSFYDDVGNLVLVRSAQEETRYKYNGFGEVIERESSTTGTVLFEYDKAGNVKEVLQANGQVIRHEYDLLSRLKSTEFISSQEFVEYTYDNSTAFSNSSGRLLKIQDWSGQQEFAYDAWGNVNQHAVTQFGATFTTLYEHSSYGELKKIVYPDGRVIDYNYTSHQLSSIALDGANVISNIERLPYGPVKSWQFGNGITLSKEHNLNYQVTNQTAGNLLNRIYEYDGEGQLTSIDDTLDSTYSRSFQYSAQSFLTGSESDTSISVYKYAGSYQRLSEATCEKNSTITSIEDCSAWLETMFDACETGETECIVTYCSVYPDNDFCYDGHCSTDLNDPDCNIPDCQADPELCLDGVCSDLPYDPDCDDGDCESDPYCNPTFCEDFPNDPTCVDYCELYPEDPSCNVSYCEENPNTPFCNPNYCAENPNDEFCLQICAIDPSLPECSAYKTNFRKFVDIQKSNKKKLHLMLQKKKAAKNVNNNKLKRKQVATKIRDRLKSSSFRLNSQSTAEEGGNRFKYFNYQADQGSNYPDENQTLTSVGQTHYQYDLQGNTIAAANPYTGEYTTFEYNAQSRLKRIEDNSSIEYFYNVQGLRIAKVVNGNLTQYLYDLSGQLIAEVDQFGEISRGYLWYQGESIALYDDETYYYHNSLTGTPNYITDQNQNIVWQATYSDFGEALIINEQITNNLRFIGQYYDNESGFHYNQQRYYDPYTGRYITSDPIGLTGGINSYVYALNNPIMYVDPNGEIAHLIFMGMFMGGAFGAVHGFVSEMFANGGNIDCVDWWRVGKDAAMGAMVGGFEVMAFATVGHVLRFASLFRYAGLPYNTIKRAGTTNKLGKEVWAREAKLRGREIESYLTRTDYKDWQRTDNLINPATNNPYKSNNFRLVDFQLGNNVVSLKTVNTNGKSWIRDMKAHIIELQKTNITVDGISANKILDIRVQPGGFDAAKFLIRFGQERNIPVIIKEFGG